MISPIEPSDETSVQFSSVAQSCLTLCDPKDCTTPGFPVQHQLLDLLRLVSIESVMPSNHFILCRPLLLPPSLFSIIRVFYKESALCIRWPKYWSFSFSFSISPFNEYSGLISFRIDWFDLLAVSARAHPDFGGWGTSGEVSGSPCRRTYKMGGIFPVFLGKM